MPQTFAAAQLSEFADNDRKSIVIDDDIPALLLKFGNDFYCIEDTCSHDGQPLTDGPIADCQIACPRHGARFDLKTGAATCMPATDGIRTFAVEVRDDTIYVTHDE